MNITLDFKKLLGLNSNSSLSKIGDIETITKASPPNTNEKSVKKS